MRYRLSKRSYQRLEGVHPRLVTFVEGLIEVTPVDFTVLEGVRTKDKQREYVAKGVSKTMNSRHLIQKDGYGHAVDLGAMVGNSVRWEWDLYFQLADAAIVLAGDMITYESKENIRWGGCWQFLTDMEDARESVNAYTDRRRAQGRTPFLDGPHYQIEFLS